MSDLLAAAAAYDGAVWDEETGAVPARGLFAAALVLDLPVAEAFNRLLDAGLLAFEFFDTGVKSSYGSGSMRVVRRVSLRKF